MLSTLPKLADKNFVIGFFLPALLGAIAAAWTFPEIVVLEPLRSLSITDKQLSEIGFLVLGIWLTAIVLMIANYALFRVLEGYLPPFSWITPLRSWQQRRFHELRAQHDVVAAEWEKAQREGRLLPQADQQRFANLRLEMLARYPTTEAEVMPTAFGNVLRAVEVYPRQVYGADAIPVWLRLAAVVPKDYAAQVNDERAQTDCLVNVTFLAFVIAVAALVRAIVHTVGWMPEVAEHLMAGTVGGSGMRRWLFAAVVGFIMSWLSYRWAVVRAVAWGEAIKSAFDCYLPALIKQLGYTVPPTEVERRTFWEQFNARVLYQYPMPREWPVAAKADGGEKLERSPNATENDAEQDDGDVESKSSEGREETLSPTKQRHADGNEATATQPSNL